MKYINDISNVNCDKLLWLKDFREAWEEWQWHKYSLYVQTMSSTVNWSCHGRVWDGNGCFPVIRREITRKRHYCVLILLRSSTLTIELRVFAFTAPPSPRPTIITRCPARPNRKYSHRYTSKRRLIYFSTFRFCLLCFFVGIRRWNYAFWKMEPSNWNQARRAHRTMCRLSAARRNAKKRSKSTRHREGWRTVSVSLVERFSVSLFTSGTADAFQTLHFSLIY